MQGIGKTLAGTTHPVLSTGTTTLRLNTLRWASTLVAIESPLYFSGCQHLAPPHVALLLNATISEPELASKGGKSRITKPKNCLHCALETTQEAHKKLLKGCDEEVAQIRRQHGEKARAAGTFKEKFDSLASRSETLEGAREQVQRNVAGLWEGMSAQ